MNNLAQVSVVIPVYNVAPYLRKCLDSVVSQSLQNIEIICVDDGSTDESSAILKEYAEKDDRFQVLHQKNGGPGKARNAGLALVTSEYLIFLDSDDWFEEKMLEEMTERAKSSGAEITICRSEGFDTDTGTSQPSEWMLRKEFLPASIFTPQEIAPHLFQFTYGWPWDKLYRTEFVKKQRLVFPVLPNSEDLVFVFQSLAMANRITMIDKLLVHHRTSRLSSVSNSRYRDPEIPYLAAKLLRSGLVERNLYKEYEKSYLNWAMDFLVWNAANMGNQKSQRYFLRKLKEYWLSDFDFDRHGADYYENRTTYWKYMFVKYAPSMVFSIITAAYHFGKKMKDL